MRLHVGICLITMMMIPGTSAFHLFLIHRFSISVLAKVQNSKETQHAFSIAEVPVQEAPFSHRASMSPTPEGLLALRLPSSSLFDLTTGTFRGSVPFRRVESKQ